MAAYDDYINAEEAQKARDNVYAAVLSGELPQKAAATLKEARRWGVGVDELATITPQMRADRIADEANFLNLQRQAPNLIRALGDPAKATVLQSDIEHQALMERMIHAMLPSGGQAVDIGSTIANAWGRALMQSTYNAQTLGGVGMMINAQRELQRMGEIDAALKDGSKSIEELFGTEADSSGVLGYKAYMDMHDTAERQLKERIQYGAERVKYEDYITSKYPMAESTQRAFSDENRNDIGKVTEALSEHPILSMIDIALPSMIQMLPAIAASMIAGNPAVGAMLMGGFSYFTDTGAQAREELERAGVNFNNPNEVTQFFLDPKNRHLLEEAATRTQLHAIPVAALDAVSMGIASKVLLPKVLISRWAEAPLKRGVSNMFMQTSAGAVLGASGEAGGQLLAYGQIESVADVVAEAIGEWALAPVEVLAQSVEISQEIRNTQQLAQEKMRLFRAATEVKQAAELNGLDRETQLEVIRVNARDAGVENVTINVDSFHQLGMDDLFRNDPAVQQSVTAAEPVHGNVEIDFATYMDRVSDLTPEQQTNLNSRVQFGETPSVTDNTTDATIADDEAAKKLENARQENAKAKTFKQELAEVGRTVGTQLRRSGEDKAVANAIQAVVQSFVGTMAQQLGVSPKEIWSRYGAMYMGEPDVRRDANGKLVSVKGMTPEQIQAQGYSQQSMGDYFPKLFGKQGLVVRWRNANRSTLLHETGHLFLEGRMQALYDLVKAHPDLNVLPATAKEFVRGTQAIMDFLGVKSVDDWQKLSIPERREMHEKFARHFESYAMRGETSNPALVNAFKAFKTFLSRIYQCLSNWVQAIPNPSTLNPEVVEMFNAMFLSEAQINEASIRQGLSPIFESQQASGMNNNEWEAYQLAQNNIVAEAEAEQTSRNMRILRRFQRERNRVMRELKKEGKGQYAELWRQEKKAYDESRIGKAQNRILNEQNAEGVKSNHLNYDELIELGIRKKDVEALYKAGYVRKQGMLSELPADVLAAALGYANENELVTDLIQNINPKEVIRQNALTRLEESNPELINPDRMQQVAESAVFNNAKMRMLGAELQALKRIGKKVTGLTADVAQTMAEATVAKMRYTDLRPIQYVRAAARAAKESLNAFSEGRIEEAISAKEKELCLAAMAQASKEAVMEYNNNVRKLRTDYNKPKIAGIFTPALVVMQRALANMGFVREERVKLNPAEQSFQEELRSLETDLEHEFEVSDDLLTDINRGDRAVFETPERAREFFDLMNQIELAGRNQEKIRVGNIKQAAMEVQEQGAKTINEVAQEHGRKEKLKLWQRYEVSSKTARWGQALVNFGLNHARAAALIALLDGKWDGYLSHLVIYSSDKCGTEKAKLKAQKTRQVDNILHDVYKELADPTRKTSQTFSNGRDNTFSTQEAFVLLLNYGNEGNRQRAIATMNHRLGYDIRGEFNPADPTSVRAAEQRADNLMATFFQEYLDPKYYTKAQQLWNVFDDVKEKTGATAKRIEGREPIWVKPRAFNIGGQELQGGYYPIVYDKNASLQGANLAAVNEVKDLNSIFAQGGVSDGHLQSRVDKFDHPITLETRALYDGLNTQIHYITFAEWVNDMRKVFRKESAISQAIHENYGADFYRQITDWIKDVRAGDQGQLSTTSRTDKAARIVRQGVSLVGLGLNFGVAAVQLVGMTQSYVYNGAFWQNRGICEVFKQGPYAAYQWAAEHSDMMKDRMTTQFRELNEIHQRMAGTPNWKQWVMEKAMLPISFVQMMVDLPTWHGAYQKALYNGLSHDEAVMAADRAVTNSQGSGRPQDLSAFERGGPWAQLFTVFYSFFNMTLNLAVVEGANAKSIARAAGSTFMLLAIQPLIEYTCKEAAAALLGTGEPDDKDEDKVMKHVWGGLGYIGNFDLNLFFLIREFSNLTDIIEGRPAQYSGPAGLRLFSEGYKLTNAIARGTRSEITYSVMRDFISGMGMFLRLPVLPVTRYLKGRQLHEEGKSDSFYSYISGR